MFGKKLKLPSFKRPDYSYLAIWVVAVGAAVFVLVWRLAGLTFGQIALAEGITARLSSSWHNIVNNSLFLPYKAVEWLLVEIGGHHTFTIRLASVIFALISIWLFLSITRQWFNKPTYILVTVLFGSSLWLLHFGRLGVPAIMFTVAPLSAIGLLLWLSNLKRVNHYLVALTLVAVLALTLYIPGMWLMWLVIGVWQRKKFTQLIKKLQPKPLIIGAVALAVLLVPLAFSFVSHPRLIEAWLGYSPTSASLGNVAKQFVLWPTYLLVYGPNLQPTWWLARQPVIAIFPAVMALTGLVFYIKNYRLRQAKLIGLALAVALILFVLAGPGALGFSVGPIFLLAGCGIGLLITRWREVFPRNPLAYNFAILILAVAAALSVIYTTKSYFVAWHYHPETKQAFKQPFAIINTKN